MSNLPEPDRIQTQLNGDVYYLKKRSTGPSSINADGTMCWCAVQEGCIFHREEGPAVYHLLRGKVFYYLKNRELTPREFLDWRVRCVEESLVTPAAATLRVL